MDHDLDKARNLKLLLCAFEELSGLKINFYKSELFCFGDAAESAPEYAEIFGCQLGQFPIRYLGIPIHYRRLTIAEWKHVEERLEKRLASWKAKLLSYGGRLILINSVLSNMVLYMLSFFHLPKGVLQRLDYFRSRFFWQCDNESKKYRLARWSVLCRPKSQGGLGIQDLEIKNIALLSKWVYKLLTENGVWQEIIRNKYVGSNAISQIHWKPGDSHFWSGVMKAKEFFFQFGTFSVRDGSQVRFWEDTWLGNNSLMVQYPSLYQIVRHKFVTIKQVLGQENPDISFRMALLGHRLAVWNELLTRLEDIQLSGEPDIFRWNLHQNGKFSVKSMYDAMVHCDVPVDNRKLWKLKIPLRVKIFLWFLNKGVILTRDNLARRNWHGSKTCVFCQHDESIKHLFFECKFARAVWAIVQVASNLYPPRSARNMFGNWLRGIDKQFSAHILVGAAALCWAMWLTRNDVVFNNKCVSSPMQVIHVCTRWLRTWSILQKPEDRDLFMMASTRLERTAREVFYPHGWRCDLRIGSTAP